MLIKVVTLVYNIERFKDIVWESIVGAFATHFKSHMLIGTR